MTTVQLAMTRSGSLLLTHSVHSASSAGGVWAEAVWAGQMEAKLRSIIAAAAFPDLVGIAHSFSPDSPPDGRQPSRVVSASASVARMERSAIRNSRIPLRFMRLHA